MHRYPLAGLHGASRKEKAAAKAAFAANALRLPVTRIFRCVFDVVEAPGWADATDWERAAWGAENVECSVVGGRHPKANGIAAYRGDIYVVDSLDFSITVYARVAASSAGVGRERSMCR